MCQSQTENRSNDKDLRAFIVYESDITKVTHVWFDLCVHSSTEESRRQSKLMIRMWMRIN